MYAKNKDEYQPCELGSGRFSRGTRCITLVLPTAKFRAEREKNQDHINNFLLFFEKRD
jgi:hypothetical protein